jgi:hypothetical protein
MADIGGGTARARMWREDACAQKASSLEEISRRGRRIRMGPVHWAGIVGEQGLSFNVLSFGGMGADWGMEDAGDHSSYMVSRMAKPAPSVIEDIRETEREVREVPRRRWEALAERAV